MGTLPGTASSGTPQTPGDPALLACGALGEALVPLSIATEGTCGADGGAVPRGGRGHLRDVAAASQCSRMARRALPGPEAWPGQQPRSAGWLREGAGFSLELAGAKPLPVPLAGMR